MPASRCSTAARLGPIVRLAVAEHASLPAAIAAVLDAEGAGRRIGRAVLAIAGPVEGGRAAFTNADWVADAAELARTFGFASVRLVNDFAAQAWALPDLAAADLRPLGGGPAVAGAPMAVLGPGTGLGVAALVPACRRRRRDRHRGRPRHAARHLGARRRHHRPPARALRPRVGGMRAVGAGTGQSARGHRRARRRAPRSAHGRPTSPRRRWRGPARCAARRWIRSAPCSARWPATSRCRSARAAACSSPAASRRASSSHLARSAFRARFEAKGRFRDYLAAIPVHVVLHADPAFVGLAAIARSPAIEP